ncbi:MAG: hypothetical protein RMH75_04515 [Archaeoglobaceae archaeon]|nr:hypothetical protein [Archaeoglobaceae archaeon]MDW7989911.1 hypothetical protein [Archaeoglobaceae archaeon]
MSYAEQILKFKDEKKDLFLDWFVEKIEKLHKYEISAQAKQVEIWEILGILRITMKPDECK